jgi:hypothetical protein
LGHILNGRLPAQRPAMRQLISDLQHEVSEEFNARVAREFREAGYEVREKVKRFGRLRIERDHGQDLGDIDVLVLDRPSRRLIAVEVKCFAGARTPAEFGHELDALVRPTRQSRSTVEKHAERTQWLRDHLPEVLPHLGTRSDEVGNWTVESLLVLDKESAVPFLQAIPVPIRMIERLRTELGEVALAPL